MSQMRVRPTGNQDFVRLNKDFENADAGEILEWVRERFGSRAVLTSSFQTQSVPLLHLASRFFPEIEVLFLDTGFHFPETLAFRDQLVSKLGLRLKNLRNQQGHSHFLKQYGELFRSDPDRCCFLNKVEPLKMALRQAEAWVTGVRRDQTKSRKDVPIISIQPGGVVKICPMANWSRKRVWEYIEKYQLPVHGLFEAGYSSVGCSPCTRPAIGADERSGRWQDSQKTECGLHTDVEYVKSKGER
jgi:phosphoadenosine phosphosulfate reductase